MKLLFTSCISILVLCFNAGAQSSYWQSVSSRTTKNLVSVSFGSPRVGYVSGTDGTLLRSLDGGISWSSLAYSGLGISPTNPDIIHLNFNSAAIGYAIVGSIANPVYKGTLYKTSDSGKTWTNVNAGNIAMSRTFFFDAANGFGIGAAFFAGQTLVKQMAGAWGPEQYFSFNPAQFLYGIDFRNTSVGIVGGYGGYVYRTFNGGVSWDTVKTPTDSNINSLKFLTNGTIMGATDNDGGAIIMSYDTGRTWTIDMNTLTFAYPDIKGLAVSKHDSFIAVGHASFGYSGIILWHNGAHVFNHMSVQHLNEVAMRDDSVAYVVGDSGTILTNRQAVLGVSGPANAALSLKVFPNPAVKACFTESTYLHSVMLYDALGRLVLSQSSPAYRHTIPLAGLGSGVYVLESTSGNGTHDYRRLVVE